MTWLSAVGDSLLTHRRVRREGGWGGPWLWPAGHRQGIQTCRKMSFISCTTHRNAGLIKLSCSLILPFNGWMPRVRAVVGIQVTGATPTTRISHSQTPATFPDRQSLPAAPAGICHIPSGVQSVSQLHTFTHIQCVPQKSLVNSYSRRYRTMFKW